MEKSLILFHHERLKEKIKAAFSLASQWPMLKEGTSLKNFITIGRRLFRK
jgi:hypothetical protein